MAGLTTIEQDALTQFVGAVRQEFPGQVEQISAVHSDATEESDIDLLVVLGPGMGTLEHRRKVSRLIAKPVVEFGIVISPKVIDHEHYEKLQTSGDPIFLNIQKDGRAL